MSVGSIVNLAAGKVAELIVQEVKFLYSVKGQVESLKKELERMSSFLSDMEDIDEKFDQQTYTLMKQTRKIAYDAEDVIESYILEAKPIANKVDDIIDRYVCFCSCLSRTHQVGSKIESIKLEISETMESWKSYHGASGVRTNAKKGLKGGAVTYAHNNEELVVGFDEDISKLVGVLTCDNIQIRIVSLVGMGGSGKTTLARKLFNHEDLKEQYDCKVWVSVSQSWVAQQILRDILKKAGGVIDEGWSHGELGEKLYKYLKEKTYLIVLDDVWENEALKLILPALPFGSDGRKVIVTTRNKTLVDYPDLKPFTYSYKPSRLNEKDSWELFRKIALIHREESCSPDIAKMKALGKEMLKKCAGLPLAIIALAGILQDKETLEDWEKVKKVVSLRILEDGKGTHLYGPVNEMLALSYNDLPRELKPCFLHLASYEEDSKIYVGKLMRLWIAEGFCTQEDVARRYLDELVHRCLVLVERRNYEGKVKVIQIHDLVRDLCIRKAKETDFYGNQTLTSDSPDLDAIVAVSRRIAIYSLNRTEFPVSRMSHHVRSLLYQAKWGVNKDQSLPLQLIPQHLRLLRVLILAHFSTSDGTIPSEIGSLIHLKYLALRLSNIYELPSSIGNLRNLLTLDYSCCDSRKEVVIPDSLWKIEGLRYLSLPYNNSIKSTFKLRTLKSLLHLKGIQGGDWMLEELPRLSPSLEMLYIRGITSNKQLEAAFRCPAIRSDRLRSLWLKFDKPEGEGEVVTLKSLEPVLHCQHLRKLHLDGRIEEGNCLQFCTCIKSLMLSFTMLQGEATLGALGKLPYLIVLQLNYKSYMGTNWTCTAGQFQQLKHLTLWCLPNLEGWVIEDGAMPQLKTLLLYDLPKLRRLPEGLKSITTLQELNAVSMTGELHKRTEGGENGGGEDAHIIQHVPRVTFSRNYVVEAVLSKS